MLAAQLSAQRAVNGALLYSAVTQTAESNRVIDTTISCCLGRGFPIHNSRSPLSEGGMGGHDLEAKLKVLLSVLLSMWLASAAQLPLRVNAGYAPIICLRHVPLQRGDGQVC